MSSILFTDYETQNNPYYGGVATPYCPDNYIVESGWRIDRTNQDGTVSVGEVGSKRYESKEEFLAAPVSEWFPIQDDTWLIVAHNLAYECSWWLTYAREEFEAFLKRGGRVFCTMHAEYIASDFQNLYPSLDETAPKYGGTHKVDGVKLLWQQGVLTSDIDPVMLHTYLAGPEGDIVNTAITFYGQCKLFAERDQMPLVWERQEAVLALSYCEFNGVYVDMPTARANQKEQEEAIQKLRELLQTFLPELPEGFEFNWNSGYHMSALVYGGTVKYKCKVPYDPPKYVKVEVQDGFYKSGRNKGMPKYIKVDTDEQVMKWGERLYRFEGLVNIQDLPIALREKYGDRGEFKGAQTLADGSPVYSTGTDAMKELADYFISMGKDDHASGFFKAYNELTLRQKDLGFYEVIDYNKDGSVRKVTGMLPYVIPQKEDGSGIIHHRLNHCATTTGRLSSSSPNMQQIPRDSKVKQILRSRYGENGMIAQCDYSAMEVVMGCVITGDKKLLSLLEAGTDMHCYRLAFQEGMSYEEVYELCHNPDAPNHKEWKKKRTAIKTFSFA